MKQGFTLIELLTVLAIISLLACFAYPNYQQHLIKAHRLDGQTALLVAANQMEHYFSLYNTYENAILIQQQSSNGWYNLSIIEATETAFILHATPIKADALCQTLTFNQLGEKGSTAEKNQHHNCWI